jgi:hypothetical protein
MIDLLPYDHDRPCPKCRFMAGTTEFQTGYHGPECAFPEGAEIDAYWWMRGRLQWGRPDPETLAQEEKNDAYKAKAAAIPEHFERLCPNCKHRWAEAVV